jgi:hypothetical protein
MMLHERSVLGMLEENSLESVNFVVMMNIIRVCYVK